MTVLPDGKHKQNPRIVVSIFFANADRATIQNGDPVTASDGLVMLLQASLGRHSVIEPPVSH